MAAAKMARLAAFKRNIEPPRLACANARCDVKGQPLPVLCCFLGGLDKSKSGERRLDQEDFALPDDPVGLQRVAANAARRLTILPGRLGLLRALDTALSVLMQVETLGEALAAGWRVYACCLDGAVEYSQRRGAIIKPN
jgi:hypothetical protein